MVRHALAISLALGAVLASGSAWGQVLLRDDFDGTALDTARWFVPIGDGSFFGRTQIRPPTELFTVAGGVIRLQLDTHNPDAKEPGDSFWGSEIDTLDSYAVESGLVFEARVRLVGPLPGGLVGAVFSFVFHSGSETRDEIDVELLSNDLVAAQERVLTNVFDDDDFSQPGAKSFASVAGLDLAEFHVYQVRWFPDRVQWFIDGDLVRQESATVPDDPMRVRLNFWAPDAFFVEAFDASLQPVASAEENETFFYEVDYVEVRRLRSVSGLGPAFGALLGAALLLAAAWLRGDGRFVHPSVEPRSTTR